MRMMLRAINHSHKFAQAAKTGSLTMQACVIIAASRGELASFVAMVAGGLHPDMIIA
jgi:hypothetical protein